MKLIDILSIALAVSAALTFGTIFIIFLRKALKKKEPVLATPYDPEKIARSIIGSQTQEGF